MPGPNIRARTPLEPVVSCPLKTDENGHLRDEDLEMLFGILDDENDGEINTDKRTCLHVDMFALVDVGQTDH